MPILHPNNLLQHIRNAFDAWQEDKKNFRAMQALKSLREIPDKLRTPEADLTKLLLLEAIGNRVTSIVIQLGTEEKPPAIYFRTGDDQVKYSYPISAIKQIAQNFLYFADRDFALKEEEYNSGVTERPVVFDFPHFESITIKGKICYRFQRLEDILAMTTEQFMAQGQFEERLEVFLLYEHK